MGKNLGIGKVYTYRLQDTKNIGYGYIQPNPYEKTRNIGIGRFGLSNEQNDGSEGMVIVDGETLYVISGEGSGTKPVPVVQPMSLRFAFSNESSDPTTLGMTKGTWTKVDNYPDEVNVWDWTYDNPDWSEVFFQKLQGTFDPDIRIIDAGDTSNVTNMNDMFYNCSGLTTVALFDTSNVTNMQYMFQNCSSLTSVPQFDTSNVTNMQGIFRNCTSLTSVPLFDTSKVTNMRYMFSTCETLTSVPQFDTSKVTNMQSMFSICKTLTSVPQFDTSNVTNMEGMFRNCTSLTSVPLFDTSKVTNMRYMFTSCANIESGMLDLYNNAKSNVTSYGNCFTSAGTNTESGRAERAEIPQSWGGDKQEIPAIDPMTLRFAFSNESSDPTTLGMTKGTWTKVDNYPEYSNVWDWTYDNPDWTKVFESKLHDVFDRDIKIIDAGDTSNVTSMEFMFNFCSGITTVALFDTSNVTSMRAMFRSCTRLTSVPLFDTHNVTNMLQMFSHCEKLTSVPLFDTHNVTSMSEMFANCSILTSVPLFDTHNVTSMSYMLMYCTKLTSVPQFDTSNVTNMNSMFNSCYDLTSLPEINITNVTNTSAMFGNTINLITIEGIVPPTSGVIRSLPSNLTNFGGFIGLTTSIFSSTSKTELLQVGGNNLTAESIHNIVTQATGGTDEENRIYVRVSSTAYNRWQLSEYYADDVAMCSQKHLTITTSDTPG